jgi:hypothetical protein
VPGWLAGKSGAGGRGRRIDQRLLVAAAVQLPDQAGRRLRCGRAGIGEAAAITLAGEAGIAATHHILAGLGILDPRATIAAAADQPRAVILGLGGTNGAKGDHRSNQGGAEHDEVSVWAGRWPGVGDLIPLD